MFIILFLRMCCVISVLVSPAPSLQRSASVPGGVQPQVTGIIMYLLPYVICISPAPSHWVSKLVGSPNMLLCGLHFALF